MKKTLFVLTLCSVLMASFITGCNNSGSSSGDIYNSKSKPATEIDNSVALQWMDLLLDQVKFQRVGPPPAARAMAYFGAAMYQSVVPGIQGGHSLEGQLKDLKDLPKSDPNLEYDWLTVMNNCLYLVVDEGLARYTGPNTPNMNILRDKINHVRDSILANPDVFNRSKEYGDALGNAFIAYMTTDNYDYTRENNIFESPSRAEHPDYWEPTDVNQTPFEPFWGTLRPMGIDTNEFCIMNPTIPYSQDLNSDFYKFCEKLYGIDTSFSEYNRITSLYWADDVAETFTPPGHWMKIAKQQIRNHNFNLAQTAELYAYFGMSVYNASISMWKIKYATNLVRPKTYVNEVLNKPDWEPYIETPPFPEYPSGHSGFSGAACSVLNHYFGENVEFTDSTNMLIGLHPRHFKSFDAAAEEAAWSRMYGGIHYEAAIKDAAILGRCIAGNVMKNIKLGSGEQSTVSN